MWTWPSQVERARLQLWAGDWWWAGGSWSHLADAGSWSMVLWGMLDFGRAALHSCSQLLWTVWEPQDFLSTFCIWCCSLGFIKPGPSTCTIAVCSRWDQDQHLQVRGNGSRLKTGGSPSPEVLPEVEEFGDQGLLFKSKGKMELEMDGWLNAASTVMWLGSRKSPKLKPSVYCSVAPTLSCGHELWVRKDKILDLSSQNEFPPLGCESPRRTRAAAPPHRQESLASVWEVFWRRSPQRRRPQSPCWSSCQGWGKSEHLCGLSPGLVDEGERPAVAKLNTKCN